jgi:hypothetical protein
LVFPISKPQLVIQDYSYRRNRGPNWLIVEPIRMDLNGF